MVSDSGSGDRLRYSLLSIHTSWKIQGGQGVLGLSVGRRGGRIVDQPVRLIRLSVWRERRINFKCPLLFDPWRAIDPLAIAHRLVYFER